MSARSMFELMLKEFGDEIGRPLDLDDLGRCVLAMGGDTECVHDAALGERPDESVAEVQGLLPAACHIP